MNAFRFERVIALQEADYVDLRSAQPVSRRNGWFVVLLIVVSALLYLSRWTALIGTVTLVTAALIGFTPWLLRRGAREEFLRTPYLQGPASHGVSEASLWVHSGSLRSESDWSGLRIWDLKKGWLLLSAVGMPQVLLREEDLRAAGLYDQVLALAQRHGVRFDSPEARTGIWPPAS